MTLLYVLGYVVAALITCRVIYLIAFKEEYEDCQAKGITDEKWMINYASRVAFANSLTGLIWPVAIPLLIAIAIISADTPIEKEIKKRKIQEQFDAKVNDELNRLRKLFEESMPKDATYDEEALRKLAEENVRSGNDS